MANWRLGLFVACLTAAGVFSAPAPASAKDCAAWNNWCRPACGDWNGHCAGQSLPQIISRMSPRSYFADPWWYGQRSDTPYREPRWQGTPPKPKAKARAGKNKAKSAKASGASSR